MAEVHSGGRRLSLSTKFDELFEKGMKASKEMRSKENSPGLLSFESFLKSIYTEPPKLAQNQNLDEASSDESEDEYAFLMTDNSNTSKAPSSGGKKRLSFSAATATTKPAAKSTASTNNSVGTKKVQAAVPLGRTPKSTATAKSAQSAQDAGGALIDENYDRQFGQMPDEDLYYALPPGLNAAKGARAGTKQPPAPTSLSEEPAGYHGANDYGDDFSHDMHVEDAEPIAEPPKEKGKPGRKPRAATPAKAVTVAKELTAKRGAKPASPKVAKPPPKDAKKAAAAAERERKKAEKEEQRREKERAKQEKKEKAEQAKRDKADKAKAAKAAAAMEVEKPKAVAPKATAKSAAAKAATTVKATAASAKKTKASEAKAQTIAEEENAEKENVPSKKRGPPKPKESLESKKQRRQSLTLTPRKEGTYTLGDTQVPKPVEYEGTMLSRRERRHPIEPVRFWKGERIEYTHTHTPVKVVYMKNQTTTTPFKPDQKEKAAEK